MKHFVYLTLRSAWIAILLMASVLVSHAQDSLQTGGDRCATPALTPAERVEFAKRIELAFKLKQATAGQKNGIIEYIPLKPHILRRANGTGNISMRALNNLIALNNRTFAPGELHFYFCGTSPNYINNDSLYTRFDMYSDEWIAMQNDVNNAMNMYFVNVFDRSSVAGYAYFSNSNVSSTRSFIRTSNVAEKYVGEYVINHELGHNFDLPHTHEGSTSTETDELVTRGAGSNCAIFGDQLCDTDADPYGRTGATTTNVNGCKTYTGTITDPNGALYTPPLSNIMSYWDGCNPNFTPGQVTVMESALAYRRTRVQYNMSCAPAVVAAPTNVTAIVSAQVGVRLQWTDNANNEMGYFIERATSASGPFLPIGGVGPNSTAYLDGDVVAQTSYWYRIRPSNSTTGGLSSVVTTSTGASVCRINFGDACLEGDGLNSLTINGSVASQNTGCTTVGLRSGSGSPINVPAGTPISVVGQFINGTRPERVTIWVDANRNGTFESGERYYNPSTTLASGFTGSMTIPSSTSAGPLNMRIIVRYNAAPSDPCGSYSLGEAEDYVLNVIGSCATPTGLTSATVAGPASTHNRRVQWTAVAGNTYSLTIREGSSPTPVVVTGLTSNTYVANLSFGTSVTISVQTTCTNTVTSLPTTLTLATPAPPGGCTVMQTVKAGNWTDPTVWSCNRLPLSTDVVAIRHAVTVPANTRADALRLTFETGGQLRFGSLGAVRLR